MIEPTGATPLDPSDSEPPPVAPGAALPAAPPVATGGVPPLLPPLIPADKAAVPPRVWPSLLTAINGMVAAVFASGTAITLVALLSNPRSIRGHAQQNIEQWLEANLATFPAILAAIVPGQLAFFGVAVISAACGREHWRSRLGFVRWKTSHATVALAVLGSLGVQYAIDFVAGLVIDEPSDALKLLMRMFSEPQGMAAVGAALVISVLPGLCEETLFRGFTQRGLLRRWHPAAAIGMTSALFALAHFDVQHSLAVLPLGAWFGFVAWRTGSVWPGMMCHFAVNMTAFVGMRLWGDAETFESPQSPVAYALGAVLVGVTFLSTVRLMRTKPE